MKIIETDNAGEPTAIEISGIRFVRRSFHDGDRVVATNGLRKGQAGRVVDPTGVEASWVCWKSGPPTIYPHDSMERVK